MTLLEVDASVVHAGWLPLILTGVVALVLVGIYFSMRHHLKIAYTFPTEDDVANASAPTSSATPTE